MLLCCIRLFYAWFDFLRITLRFLTSMCLYIPLDFMGTKSPWYSRIFCPLNAETPILLPVAQSIFFSALFFCTVRTILDASGGRIDILSTNHTSLRIQTTVYCGTQRPVAWQDCKAKPFAKDRVGPPLYTRTFLTIVQHDTVAVSVIAALISDQLSCFQ